MAASPRFELQGGPLCPVAQTVRTALIVCGAAWDAQAAPEGARAWLTLKEKGRCRRTDDPVEMLGIVAAAHPGAGLLPQGEPARAATHALALRALDLRRRLSAVTRATNSIDHDIAVHRLRDALGRLEAALPAPDPATPIDLVGVSLAPPLWRMRVLDAHHETFLLTGLPRLAAWGAALSAHPAVLDALGRDPEAAYLALLARRGAALVAGVDAALWRLTDRPGQAPRGIG